MKKLLLWSFLLIPFFNSCTTSKLSTVTSESVSFKNSNFIFENDTVLITYNFWGANGVMSFDIYNKINQPIYFDWKNSAFIPNNQMVSYWQDATNTVGSSSSSTSWLYGGVISSSRGVSKSIRQERIGVIPPRSMITKSDFKLVKSANSIPKSGNYNRENSFLKFRNYLMFCTNEKFEGQVHVVDNDFFVSNIKIIHLQKKDRYKAQNCFYSKPLLK